MEGNPWLPRFWFLLAGFALAVIVSGAFITSTEVALAPGQSGPGSGLHRVIAFLAFALVGGALIAGTRSPAHRVVAGSALVMFVASGIVGWRPPLSPSAAVWHAALSHLFAAFVAAALVMATPAWARPIQPIDAGSWRALRPAALATPFAVFGQIVMGALYRHQITGIMPHMLGAMIVALLTMFVSAVVLQHFAESKQLKRAAALLISAVLTQVCLGIAVFLMLLLNVSGTAAFIWIATAHVTTGTLVSAASVIMALQIWRNLAPPGQRDRVAATFEGGSPSGRS